MRRLELRLAARGVALSSAARLLRRLFPRAQRDAPLERYPPRVLLCAFMVVRYPQVVFSAGGARPSGEPGLPCPSSTWFLVVCSVFN